MNIKLIEKVRALNCRESVIGDHGVSGFKIRKIYRLAIPVLFWVVFYRIANSYTRGRRIANSPEPEGPERGGEAERGEELYRIANSYTRGRRIANSPEPEEPERKEKERGEDDIGITDEEILDRI